MSDTVIKVENLSKKYILRHQRQERYTALRDVMARGAKSLGKKLVAPFIGGSDHHLSFSDTQEEFYALKDVSFEVKQGDRVGIIGRNGAGKSTLLKLLSRITEPTSGRIEITGRVASLIEVGTGFHPELTGRENIFLNGAIMGMTKGEIKRKFGEIVEFAEVEKFLDTPVKHYSSGMYMRLAFAVAAHLETEILIVDEILAVGDAQFQKKCLGKMEDVGKQGRTLLFVSHNMSAIYRLCRRGILLSEGKLLNYDNISNVVKSYMQGLEKIKHNESLTFNNINKPQFHSIRLLKKHLNYNDSLEIKIEIISPYDIDVGFEVEIHDDKRMPIAYSSTSPMGGYLLPIKCNKINKFQFMLGPLNLASGDYYLYFWLIKPWVENYHVVQQPLKFTVHLSDPCSSGFDFRQEYSRGSIAIPILLKSQ
jgi:lipopolysaccharide transport system ATP-binding protein